MQTRSLPTAVSSCLLLVALHTGLAATPIAEAEESESQSLTALLPNGKEPLPGIIVGGQPTVEQLDEAARLGLKTVINLRTEGESDVDRDEVEARGMAYVALPIGSADDLNAENAATLSEVLAEAERPVMVHCGSGNRVGALFAVKAFHVDGLEAQEALEFGREAGMTRLEEAVSAHLAAQEED